MSNDERIDRNAAAHGRDLFERKTELPRDCGFGSTRAVEPFPVTSSGGGDEEGDDSQARAAVVC
jgi:hypothetical protein